MRPEQKGLTNDDVERVLNFDWDASSDEESGDELEDISAVLEKNLEGILERGESIEIGLIENVVAEEYDEQSCSAVNMCFEKIDAKSLKWRSRPFEDPETVWKEDDILKVDIVLAPVQYFGELFDTEAFDLIAQQSDIFALQELGIELKCTKAEIRRYIGVLLYLGVFKIPQLRMAWAQNIKLTAVADSMSRDRFMKIKQCLHFSDKSKQPKKGDSNYDKLYKIRALLNILKENFNKLPQEEHQSVDEQIIAFKGMYQ